MTTIDRRLDFDYRPRRTCSRSLRDAVTAAIPAVCEDPRYMHFVSYLLFSNSRDEQSGRIMIGGKVLSQIEGKHQTYLSKNYNAKAFLEEIQQIVLPEFDWGGYRYKAVTEDGEVLPNKVRTVTKTGLPDDLLKLAQLEQRAHRKDDDRVEMLTGHSYNAKKRSVYRHEDQIHALGELARQECKEAVTVMDYLNHLPANRFEQLRQNMDQAYAIIDQEKRSTPQATDAFRCLQNGILDATQDQPQPMYKSATNPNCTRSFSDNLSILMVFRPARKVLTQGARWLEFDLKSAQLAICATDWNIPKVQNFLRCDTNSIWKDLARHFDTELTPALKDVFKDNLYAVLFGADKRWVKSEVTKQTGIKKAGNLFCTHPIVAAMLETREQRLEQIRNDGGAENCFGMWVPIPKDDNGRPNPRSVLAVLAQARELQLLYPAFELAMSTDAYDITLYQHDGFCMAVKDKSRTNKAVREVTQAVQRKADELRIVTYLEQDS